MSLPDVITIRGVNYTRERNRHSGRPTMTWRAGYSCLTRDRRCWRYVGVVPGRHWVTSGWHTTPVAAYRAALEVARRKTRRECDETLAALDAAERELAND